MKLHKLGNGFGVALVDRAWRVVVELRQGKWYLSNLQYHTRPQAVEHALNYARATMEVTR